MTLPPFANEPVLELRRAPARERLLAALDRVDATLPVRAPVWIGEDRREGEELVSTDPGDPSRVVAVAAKATEDDVRRAVAVALEAFPAWAATPAVERAAALVRAGLDHRIDWACIGE